VSWAGVAVGTDCTGGAVTDAGVGVFNGAVVLVTGALLSTGVVVPLLLKDGSAVVLGLSVGKSGTTTPVDNKAPVKVLQRH
jgi:hypothetical protein